MAGDNVENSAFALMHNIVLLRKLMQVMESIEDGSLELTLNSDFSGTLYGFSFDSVPDAVGKMKRMIESRVGERIQMANSEMKKAVERARAWEKYRSEWAEIGKNMLEGKWNVVPAVEQPERVPQRMVGGQNLEDVFDSVYKTATTAKEWRATVESADNVMRTIEEYKEVVNNFPRHVRKVLKKVT